MGLGALNQDPERAQRILREHTVLVDDIESGEPEPLDEHLRQHLGGARALLRQP